ncbi:CsbD family protein [Catenulispora sp. NF23]|uniref:CsbD family protein n=1 Tax=Catenulispora pinistramenti TaxID=2705254 RepID=A0ABS5KU76_9ACTN|nr:CsbD family protein [Catenulispora pinistramenti]MBS2533791.1 CsbD family protein [Catenulispora pinistramenti]MBS2549569.1 CsbD family protein [Catenulispora pinistramenti]
MSDLTNKGQEAVGKAKEKVGEFTGDRDMEAEGKADQTESKFKQLADDAKDMAENVADRVKDAFKK